MSPGIRAAPLRQTARGQGNTMEALLDCVDAVTEELATQALAAMRKDPYRP